MDRTFGAARPVRRFRWSRRLPSLVAVVVAGACSSSAYGGGAAGAEADAAAAHAERDRAIVLDAAEAARDDGADEQYGALRDGEATLEEYRAGVTRTIACLGEAGLSATEPRLNPVDGRRILYMIRTGPMPTQEAGNAIGRCSGRYEALLQIAYASTHPERMAPDLLDATTACLADAGHATTGDERNGPDLVATLGDDHRDTVTTCVLQEHERLYPGLTATDVTF